MFAMQTSLLRTAPAKAALAAGIGAPAIPAGRAPGAAVHWQYRLEEPLFRNRSDAQAMGSVGATVM
jgi:hypothetical protein